MITNFYCGYRPSAMRILLVVMLLALLATACSGSPENNVQLSSQQAEGDIAMQPGVDIPKVESEIPEAAPISDSDPTNVDGAGDQSGSNDPIGELPAQVPSEEMSVDTSVEALVVEDAPTVDENPNAPESVAANLPVGTQVGNMAPDFSLQTPDGATIRLSDLRGRPVVISYWASWCGPCKNEMQILQNVFQQYQDQGFTVVAVNAIEQDSLNKVAEMISQLGVTYPVVLDHGGQFADDYNALFFPTTFFVDANGVIQDLALGDSPEEQFNARVSKFLASQ